MADAPRPGFGLYVHWPFCLSKCPYCDFNSHVRARIDADAFGAALSTEMRNIAARLDSRPPLTSIFFGGGTPSLMPGSVVASVIDTARGLFGFEPGIEITLEANPTSVDAARFRDYRAAGVNRVSLGVQALDDRDLRALGRLHTVEEAMRAVGIAQETFPRVSFDLIYARPGQSPEAWERELEAALARGCTHYSLYQLTFEEGTPFHAALARGTMRELDPDTAATMYETTQSMMTRAGLPAYEISNHAAPGHEARHNLVYWRYGTYLGVGPGAHGRIAAGGGRVATETERGPEAWLGQVQAAGTGITRWEPVAAGEQATERLLMGLRLAEGVADPQALDAANVTPQRVTRLVEAGLLRRDAGRLVATPAGRIVLNSVLKELLA